MCNVPMRRFVPQSLYIVKRRLPAATTQPHPSGELLVWSARVDKIQDGRQYQELP